MSSDLSDAELVKQIQAGKEEAMSQLYRRHRPSLFRYALSKTYNQQLAEDIVGEIFLRMVQYLPTYQITGAPFTAWLFRIAHNTLITIAKKENRYLTVPLEDVNPPSNRDDGPDKQVEIQLSKEHIWQGLLHLDESQRDVVILRFLVGLSLKETAHALEKSVGAVKTLQHRGIQSLRIALNSKRSKIA